MGQIAVTPTDDMQGIVEEVGGDRNLTEYDPVAGMLIVQGVTDAELLTAKTAVTAGTRAATPRRKKEKRKIIRAAAKRAAIKVLLDADTVFQQRLADIDAATTIADLRAINYP